MLKEEKMTQLEITNKSNSYKRKLNKCNQHIDNYGQSISSFSKFKNYLTQSNLKAKKHKKIALTYACVSTALALIFIFVSWPVSIGLLVASIASFERFAFFTKVSKKFQHCIDYLSNVISNLSTKQFNYETQRDCAYEEIIKLENTLPDVIVKYFESKNDQNIEDNLDICSL